MNDRQREAINAHMSELIRALQHSVECLLNDLSVAHVINSEQREILHRHSTTREKTFELVQLLQQKDSGWQCTMEHLNHSDQKRLAETLKMAAGELSSTSQSHQFNMMGQYQ